MNVFVFATVRKRFALMLVAGLVFSTSIAQVTAVEFRVNMNYQAQLGQFDPATEFVDIAGTFNGWGNSSFVLQDPDADGIFTGTTSLNIGETIDFKARINGAWNGREEFPGGGPNRSYTVVANGVVAFWYNDDVPEDALDVRITSSALIVRPGGRVQFYDRSGGDPVEWNWSFPGGVPSVSTEPNPEVQYATAGRYPVSLSIKNAMGETTERTFSEFVNVDPMETHWWNEAVFYEVFVRSFQDSDGDGRGDLQGLIDQLDYLNDGNPDTDTDLGVTGIWLMPIQQSPSYHGYDVTDYRTIESDYGSNDDFKAFIEAAHQRGIRVIIDLVMNHTSTQHPWFQQSASSTNNRRDWYVWSNTKPSWTGPWGQEVWHQRNGSYYYGIFWGGMPDLNYENAEVQAEMFDIASFWLQEMNVDGFRLDAVKYLYEEGSNVEDLPETIEFWKDFRDHYKSVEPEAFAVGEAWTATSKVKDYVNDGGLDYCFEFDLASNILGAVNSGDPSGLKGKLEEVVRAYPHLQYGTFLTNHDMNRVMTELGSSVAKAKLAASVLFTLPGVPYVYYGEEIGMTGQGAHENIRTPMQWTSGSRAGFTSGSPWQPVNSDYTSKNVAAQQNSASSLWSHYRNWIAWRNQEAVLRRGDYLSLEASDPGVLAFLRRHGNEQVLVVHNFRTAAVADLSVNVTYAGIEEGAYTLEELLTGNTLPLVVPPAGTATTLTVDQLPGQTTRIFRFDGAATNTTGLQGGMDVSVFPLPAGEALFLELPEEVNGVVRYRIIDPLGRLVTSSVLDAGPGLQQVDLRQLVNGMYFLVLDGQGIRKTLRFIVQKEK